MSDEVILQQIVEFVDAYKGELNVIRDRKGPEAPKPRQFYWEGYTISHQDRQSYASNRFYWEQDNKRDRLKAAGKAFDLLIGALGLVALFKHQLGSKPVIAQETAAYSLFRIQDIFINAGAEVKAYTESDEAKAYEAEMKWYNAHDGYNPRKFYSDSDWLEWIFENSEDMKVAKIKQKAMGEIGKLLEQWAPKTVSAADPTRPAGDIAVATDKPAVGTPFIS